MRTAATTLIITCVLGTVYGQTYWASPDGNDAWDGLSAVISSEHGPKATIQAAVNAASNGDVVSLCDGVYSGEGNCDVDPCGKAITIKSQGGPVNCVLDISQGHRGFSLHSSEGNLTIIEGLSIVNALFYIGNGGAIYCENASPLIKNCIFRNNSGDCGGAIGYKGGNPSVENCIFLSNFAYAGGAIYGENTAISLSGCKFGSNVSANDGGAVSFVNVTAQKPRFASCVFYNNYADANGGAVSLNMANAEFENCTVTENYANVQGGAGWAIMNPNTLEIKNSIVFGNEANDVNAVAIKTGASSGGPNVQYSDVHRADFAVLSGTGGFMWGPGNIDCDPLFVMRGYWDDNGTPGNELDDFYVAGDYHLMSQGWRFVADANSWSWDEMTSLCVDGGNPADATGAEPLKLWTDPLNRFGKNIRIDMGGYGGTAEASMGPIKWAVLADLDNDGTVGLGDFAYLAGNMNASGAGAIGDITRNASVGIEDFATFAEEWLVQAGYRI